ncbi:MAG: hypothetical protein M3177_00555 [Pseudomonadota bacterium]|nr:hypothetical protein [Pseudomonadota bacterium]
MTDAATLVILASAATFALAFTAAAALKAWQAWLEVRRIGGPGSRPPSPGGGQPVDLRDLKNRVRRLEAIANGGEL